ncbi:hypothetical protein [Streptacidiphilus sp. PAMC 29251]
MAVFNRRITELIESGRADAEQYFQQLGGGADALRAETATALREVREHLDAAQRSLARELGDQGREQLAQCLTAVAGLRSEVAALRASLPEALPAAGAVPVLSVVKSCAPIEPEAGMDDDHSRILTAQASQEDGLQELFDVLTTVALISTVEIHLHPHTWAFIVRHVAQQDLIHELLPEPQEQESDVLVTVHVSGPVLMGILNALHHAMQRPRGKALTRTDIAEKALAGALYTRLSKNPATGSGPAGGTRTLIVIDDRAPDQDPPPEPAPTGTAPGSPPATGSPAAADASGGTEDDGAGAGAEGDGPVSGSGSGEDVGAQDIGADSVDDGAEAAAHVAAATAGGAEELPRPTYFLINGILLYASYPVYCVAERTTGGRCRNPLEFGQNGQWTTATTASGTQVHAYDVGHSPRWMSQHCNTHDDPATTDHCPAQWQPHPHDLDATG